MLNTRQWACLALSPRKRNLRAVASSRAITAHTLPRCAHLDVHQAQPTGRARKNHPGNLFLCYGVLFAELLADEIPELREIRDSFYHNSSWSVSVLFALWFQASRDWGKGVNLRPVFGSLDAHREPQLVILGVGHLISAAMVPETRARTAAPRMVKLTILVLK